MLYIKKNEQCIFALQEIKIQACPNKVCNIESPNKVCNTECPNNMCNTEWDLTSRLKTCA